MSFPRQFFEDFKKQAKALGAFNFCNTETLRAIVETANELATPVIVSTSESEASFLGMKQAVALVRSWQQNEVETGRDLSLRIILHLDHGKTFDSVKAALDAGYDSVHFDGSGLPLEENIRITKQIVEYAKSYHAKLVAASPNKEILKQVQDDIRVIMVEGELGYLRGASAPGQKVAIKKEDLTDPQLAAKFAQETGVDCLAVAIGNLHGIAEGGHDPHLDLERLAEIAKAVPQVKLVLHGGSGIPEEDIKKAIKLGITKINVNTDLRVAYTETLKQSLTASPQETTPYKIMSPVVAALRGVVKNKIRLFTGIKHL